MACPRCASPTLMVEVHQPSSNIFKNNNQVQNSQTVAVLVDNIRSAHNVGSIFRTSDGAGIRHVYLGGVTPTPDQPAVQKTSLGAEHSISWSYHSNGKIIAQKLREQNFLLLALETGPDSTSIFKIDYSQVSVPILLIIGNEISGIDPGILCICEKKIWIPMCGVKESLNVSNAFSIAAYTMCFRLRS